MGPFAETKTGLTPAFPPEFSGFRAPIVFALCLVLGGAAVAWRASSRGSARRAVAQTEARALGLALEQQLGQAPAAVEVLATLIRQGPTGSASFQRTARELLAAHPGLSTLELQPGGVVNDIAPRAGHERVIGMNVLKDPVHRASAIEALSRRALTVAGPVTSSLGEQAIVARVPIFQRTADGRETFWGFVAASMRLQPVVVQARLDQLPKQGYEYLFFSAPSSQQKALAIAASGPATLSDVVQQPVHVANLQLRLALKPRLGWINKTKSAVESLGVVLASILISLLVKATESRSIAEAELSRAQQQLTREESDRTQAQAFARESKDALAKVKMELELSRGKIEQAEAKAADLQASLDASILEREQNSQAGEAERKALRSRLEEAKETIAKLQARLNAAAQVEKEAAAATEERVLQQQTAASTLQTRLEETTRAAREAAKANRARLDQLEEANRELKSKLRAAEAAEGRVVELSKLLQEAKEQLQQRAATLPTADAPQTVEDVDEPPAVEIDEPSQGESDGAPNTEVEPDPSGEEARDIAAAAAPASAFEPEASPEQVGPVPADPLPSPEAVEPAAVVSSEAEEAPAAPPPQASTISKPPAKASKTRRTRRDDQMDLFRGADPTPPEKSQEKEPVRRLPAAPPVDPAQLRKSANQILPLLMDQDPGAKDCLKDNRTTFRSAFTPEGYVEFESMVKGGDFGTALEQLRKAARKHGISL